MFRIFNERPDDTDLEYINDLSKRLALKEDISFCLSQLRDSVKEHPEEVGDSSIPQIIEALNENKNDDSIVADGLSVLLVLLNDQSRKCIEYAEKITNQENSIPFFISSIFSNNQKRRQASFLLVSRLIMCQPKIFVSNINQRQEYMIRFFSCIRDSDEFIVKKFLSLVPYLVINNEEFSQIVCYNIIDTLVELIPKLKDEALKCIHSLLIGNDSNQKLFAQSNYLKGFGILLTESNEYARSILTALLTSNNSVLFLESISQSSLIPIIINNIISNNQRISNIELLTLCIQGHETNTHQIDNNLDKIIGIYSTDEKTKATLSKLISSYLGSSSSSPDQFASSLSRVCNLYSLESLIPLALICLSFSSNSKNSMNLLFSRAYASYYSGVFHQNTFIFLVKYLYEFPDACNSVYTEGNGLFKFLIFEPSNDENTAFVVLLLITIAMNLNSQDYNRIMNIITLFISIHNTIDKLDNLKLALNDNSPNLNINDCIDSSLKELTKFGNFDNQKKIEIEFSEPYCIYHNSFQDPQEKPKISIVETNNIRIDTSFCNEISQTEIENNDLSQNRSLEEFQFEINSLMNELDKEKEQMISKSHEIDFLTERNTALLYRIDQLTKESDVQSKTQIDDLQMQVYYLKSELNKHRENDDVNTQEITINKELKKSLRISGGVYACHYSKINHLLSISGQTVIDCIHEAENSFSKEDEYISTIKELRNKVIQFDNENQKLLKELISLKESSSDEKYEQLSRQILKLKKSNTRLKEKLNNKIPSDNGEIVDLKNKCAFFENQTRIDQEKITFLESMIEQQKSVTMDSSISLNNSIEILQNQIRSLTHENEQISVAIKIMQEQMKSNQKANDESITLLNGSLSQKDHFSEHCSPLNDKEYRKALRLIGKLWLSNQSQVGSS